MEDESLSSSSEATSIEEVEEENLSEVNYDQNEEQFLSPGEPCDVDSSHSKMCQDWIPTIGMKFETENDAHEFYNRYAYRFGFGTRLHKAHKFRTGFLRDRIFVCSAEGKREKNKKSMYVRASRAETRFDCKARMRIKYDPESQKYVVSEFIANHTHLTSTPRKTHRFRSHRKMSLAQNVLADMAEDSGIEPKQTLELLSRQAGGRENLGFIVEDYRNYLRSKRTEEMQAGDTGGVLEYLQKMQSCDPSFTYAIQVDVDDLITNIFWADAKMKVDYDYFGDVVCFDTTYRKNKEGRPFAMFVGVNNHKQTIIFGAALLYDETAETFMWLFDTFVKAMSGKKPQSIFTDQDLTMAKALAARWPETHHRLCIWHIYQNAAKNLKCVFEKFKDFAKEFSSLIYDYEDAEDFVSAWNDMLKEYKLEDNTWLRRLFDVKEKWALVYGRGTFNADITTTQRSESMNNSIKKYVSYKYGLVRFFRHFQRLVDDHRYCELVADFKANHTSPSLSFSVKMLRDAAKVYTPAVFKWFEAELSKARGKLVPSIPPVWERHILCSRNPPNLKAFHPEYENLLDGGDHALPTEDEADVEIIVEEDIHRSFFFGPKELSILRKLVPPHLQCCSTFEILTAFIWKCRAISIQPEPTKVMRMSCLVNARNRFNPPLIPEGYYGNCFLFSTVISKAEQVIQNPLEYSLGLIRKAKEAVTLDYIQSAMDTLVSKERPLVQIDGTYMMSDNTHSGFRDVDFGWGKAIFGGPPRAIPAMTSYYVAHQNKKGENGILLLLCLPAKAMERFEEELKNMLQEISFNASIKCSL